MSMNGENSVGSDRTELGEPRLAPGPRLAVLFAGKHSGEERIDRRTKNRPPLPRGHHSTTTIVSTIERHLRFRFNWAETTSGVRGLSAGRRQQALLRLIALATSSSWVRTATFFVLPTARAPANADFRGVSRQVFLAWP